MTTPAFEHVLARIYTDADARDRFLAAPEVEARAAGLNEFEIGSLAAIDREGLRLAARSFGLKLARQRAASTRARD